MMLVNLPEVLSNFFKEKNDLIAVLRRHFICNLINDYLRSGGRVDEISEANVVELFQEIRGDVKASD